MNRKHSAFHASLEGAQHGAKKLPEFFHFAKANGATGCQPSNFMLEDSGDRGFLPATTIKAQAQDEGIRLDGISAHCPFWVHTTAWTGSKTIRPFLPASVLNKSVGEIENWAESYILRLLDLCAELSVKIVPMFWGTAYGWELATGYPWGFWKGADYDLIKEGDERFVRKTATIRKHARERGMYLAHEIHPGTAAMCADDFIHLLSVCDIDECLAVNDDPSHTWEGESAEQRLLAIGDYVVAAHVKNHRIRPGLPLREMQPDWQIRGMQFTDLQSGEINLQRHVETLLQVGYPQRYMRIMGTDSAPLVCEAESAYRDLDETSGHGVRYIRKSLCFAPAAGSFEDGMGQAG